MPDVILVHTYASSCGGPHLTLSYLLTRSTGTGFFPVDSIAMDIDWMETQIPTTENPVPNKTPIRANIFV